MTTPRLKPSGVSSVTASKAQPQCRCLLVKNTSRAVYNLPLLLAPPLYKRARSFSVEAGASSVPPAQRNLLLQNFSAITVQTRGSVV